METAPRNVPYPPSTITGEVYRYLSTLAQFCNTLPVFSYTSYTGGPNGNLTGAPGDVVVNIVASAQTARIYIKELGSSNTGWMSFATIA